MSQRTRKKTVAKFSPRVELGRIYLERPEVVFEVILEDPELLTKVLDRVATRVKGKR